MKTVLTGVIGAVLGLAGGYVLGTTLGGNGAGSADLGTDVAKMNYVNSYNGVKLLTDEGIAVDRAAAELGLQHALGDKPSSVSEEDAIAAFKAFSEERRKTQEADRLVELQKNLEAGKAFLDAKAAEEGVVTLPSGLAYKVVEEGTGAKPTVEDTIKVHYHGMLIDGTVFDSSVVRGEPAVFGLGRVIKGWQEGLALMPEGSKYELYIPASLAYGDGGGGTIKPGSTLIFQVELIEIVDEDSADEE